MDTLEEYLDKYYRTYITLIYLAEERTLSEFRLWTSANKQKHKQHRKKQQNVGENLNKKTIQGFKKNSCF